MKIRVDLNNRSLVEAEVSYINGYKKIPSSVLNASSRVFVEASISGKVAFISVAALSCSLRNDGSKKEAKLLEETCFGLMRVDTNKLRICWEHDTFENRRTL